MPLSVKQKIISGIPDKKYKSGYRVIWGERNQQKLFSQKYLDGLGLIRLKQLIIQYQTKTDENLIHPKLADLCWEVQDWKCHHNNQALVYWTHNKFYILQKH